MKAHEGDKQKAAVWFVVFLGTLPCVHPSHLETLTLRSWSFSPYLWTYLQRTTIEGLLVLLLTVCLLVSRYDVDGARTRTSLTSPMWGAQLEQVRTM